MKVRRRLPERVPTGRDRLYTELHFADGAVVVPSNCPQNVAARSHWNADGSACLCPAGEPSSKVAAK